MTHPDNSASTGSGIPEKLQPRPSMPSGTVRARRVVSCFQLDVLSALMLVHF